MSEDCKPKDLKTRTKAFALRVIRLVNALPPRNMTAEVIGKQLLRSATSVGANYRAACRGRSKAEFASKLGIVEEEIDECSYWMDLIVESELMPQERMKELMAEAQEITAMVVASINTAKANRYG